MLERYVLVVVASFLRFLRIPLVPRLGFFVCQEIKLGILLNSLLLFRPVSKLIRVFNGLVSNKTLRNLMSIAASLF